MGKVAARGDLEFGEHLSPRTIDYHLRNSERARRSRRAHGARAASRRRPWRPVRRRTLAGEVLREPRLGHLHRHDVLRKAGVEDVRERGQGEGPGGRDLHGSTDSIRRRWSSSFQTAPRSRCPTAPPALTPPRRSARGWRGRRSRSRSTVSFEIWVGRSPRTGTAANRRPLRSSLTAAMRRSS